MNENFQADAMPAISDNDSAGQARDRTGFIAAGGLIGALAATSCCILPLVLSVAGLSGAWMVNLRAMAPYQPYFIAATLACLAYGFYLVYWKPKRVCAEGAACARPLPNRLVRGGLWLATLIVLAAITFGVWFPYLLPYLP